MMSFDAEIPEISCIGHILVIVDIIIKSAKEACQTRYLHTTHN